MVPERDWLFRWRDDMDDMEFVLLASEAAPGIHYPISLVRDQGGIARVLRLGRAGFYHATSYDKPPVPYFTNPWPVRQGSWSDVSPVLSDVNVSWIPSDVILDFNCSRDVRIRLSDGSLLEVGSLFLDPSCLSRN